MKAFPIALGFAALMTALSGGALACTIARPYPPPSQAQTDAWIRQNYIRAGAVVEVEAVRGSNSDQPGQMRVLRVHKGNIAPGALLSVRAMSTAMCGAGDFAQGSRGLIMIPHRGPITFQGYMHPAEISVLRRSGFLGSPRR